MQSIGLTLQNYEFTYGQISKLLKAMKHLPTEQLEELFMHLKAAANILNSDGLTLSELYANDKEDALKLECMAIYAFGELSRRMKNKL